MVRRMPVDDPVLNSASSEEEELIRTNHDEKDGNKQAFQTPSTICRKAGMKRDGPRSPPDIFRLSGFDFENNNDDFPLIRRSGPSDDIVPLFFGSSSDASPTPSPRGVDCRQKDLYPLYYGFELEPKSLVLSGYLEDARVASLIDLVSDLSEEEEEDDHVSLEDDLQLIEEPSLEVPLEETFLDYSSLQLRDFGSGAEETKEGDPEDAVTTRAFVLRDMNDDVPALVEEKNKPPTPSISSEAESTLDWFLGCFGCGDLTQTYQQPPSSSTQLVSHSHFGIL